MSTSSHSASVISSSLHGWAMAALLTRMPDQHEQPLASRDPRVDQVALQQHVVLRGERGSGLAGCAYNLVAEGQAIVYPIPRIWEGLIPTYRHALWGAMV